VTRIRFSIAYYQDKNGKKPVREYILGLDKNVRAKVMAYLSLLEEKGFLPFPYTSNITTVPKIRELRIRFSTNFYRIFYFLSTGKKIILLHAFTKKQKRIPKIEILKARERMLDYVQREK